MQVYLRNEQPSTCPQENLPIEKQPDPCKRRGHHQVTRNTPAAGCECRPASSARGHGGTIRLNQEKKVEQMDPETNTYARGNSRIPGRSENSGTNRTE